MKQEDEENRGGLAGMSVPKPARATRRRILAATLILLLLAAYLISYAALRNFGRIGVWTLPGAQKEYETTMRPAVRLRLPKSDPVSRGEANGHLPVNEANDGDVLPQEYRHFLNGVFGPARWVEKAVWSSSVDFNEHHTEPKKDVFGFHFNPGYKF